MRIVKISYFIMATAILSAFLVEQNAYSTHISKPIITEYRTDYETNGPIVVKGWVEYFGRPVSDVQLDTLVRAQDGTIIARHGIKSDPSGNFTANITLPKDVTPGNYTLYTISKCRIEHIEICSNQDTIIPISLVRDSKNISANSFAIPDKSTPFKSYPRLSMFGNLTPPNSKNNQIDTICSGKAATILGTTGNDFFMINNSNVVTNSLEGNDIVYVKGAGKNRICLSAGDDLVFDNGAQNNIIYGGTGNDVVTTFSNLTTVDGQAGKDIIISGGKGNFFLYGGDGPDLISDNSVGNSMIYGGIGDDVIYNVSGNDTIHGGYSNDTIFDETDESSIYGDEGYDIIPNEKSNGLIDGGNGFDICGRAMLNRACEQ